LTYGKRIADRDEIWIKWGQRWVWVKISTKIPRKIGLKMVSLESP